MYWTPDHAVWVRALAGALRCVLGNRRYLILRVPLSTQVCKWVPANLLLGGGPCDGLASHPGRVKILLVTSCYGNWVRLWPDGPLGSYADYCIQIQNYSKHVWHLLINALSVILPNKCHTIFFNASWIRNFFWKRFACWIN